MHLGQDRLLAGRGGPQELLDLGLDLLPHEGDRVLGRALDAEPECLGPGLRADEHPDDVGHVGVRVQLAVLGHLVPQPPDDLLVEVIHPAGPGWQQVGDADPLAVQLGRAPGEVLLVFAGEIEQRPREHADVPLGLFQRP